MKKKKYYNLEIEKARYKSDEGNYIIYLHSETEKGINYRRIYRGSKKACELRRKELINGNKL